MSSGIPHTTASVENAIAPASVVPLEEVAEQLPLTEQGPSKSAFDIGVKALKLTAIGVQLSPLNEAIRFGSAAAVAVATKNPWMGALVLTGTTAAVEGLSVFAAAKWVAEDRIKDVLDTLHSKLDNKPILKYLSPRRYMPDGKEVSLLAEATIAMHLGSVAVMEAKQREDPTRTVADARRRGLITTAWMSGVFAVEGALIAKGVEEYDNPRTWLLGAGVAALWAASAGYKWAKRKIKGEAEELSPAQLNYEGYRSHIEKLEVGPQLHGFNQADFEKVAEDPETRWVAKKTEEGSVLWPVLTPISNFTEYVPGFFDRTYGPDQKVYYLSMPDLEEASQDEGFNQAVAEQILQVSQEENATIVFDEMVGTDTEGYVRELLNLVRPEAEVSFEYFIDPKNNTPAQSIHYEAGVATAREVTEGRTAQPYSVDAVRAAFERRVANGEIDLSANSVTVLLNPDQMNLPYTGNNDKTTIKRLWDIYDGQFTNLIENDPARGAQTYEELEAMLTDPGTLTVAHVVDDEIVSFMMFVSNIRACDWLKPEFYENSFPGETLLYAPGIATDKTRKGHHYSFDLLNTAVKLVTDVADNVHLVWQCTNVSKDYIPKIVKQGIDATGLATVNEPQETARYSYVGMKVVSHV